MVSFLSILAVGFFLGMRHATDPDHVVAVTTIVTRQRQLSRAALTGAFWGIGHTLTILVVGALIILFNVVIPTRIGLSMEFSVALMLIFLGAMNIVAFMRATPSISPQTETDSAIPLTHAHAWRLRSQPCAPAFSGVTFFGSHSLRRTLIVMDAHRWRSSIVSSASWLLYRPVRPFLVGVVHGLAGSAAVALLVLTTIPNPRWAIAYLLVFGLGTVGGMMLITMSIASAFTFLGKGRKSFSQRLALVSGLVSLAFGMLLVYQIGFAGGLFTSHPQWTPH